MGKPWARLEIDYLDHPKFSILSSAAFRLWHAAKNYCDKWHTNGVIPVHEMKHFRSYAPKFLFELVHSAGLKSDGTPYAPLLDIDPAGYRMHDYLEHNDTRDEVLERLDDAKDRAALRQHANREYQAIHRAKRKEELEALRKHDVSSEKVLTKALRRQTASRPTDTPTPTQKREDSSEPLRDSEPAVLTFPTVGVVPTWDLHQRKIDAWAAAYPNLDILSECRKATVWLEENPSKRKTARGMGSFLLRWFRNATDRPGASGSGSNRPRSGQQIATALSPAMAARLKERAEE